MRSLLPCLGAGRQHHGGGVVSSRGQRSQAKLDVAIGSAAASVGGVAARQLMGAAIPGAWKALLSQSFVPSHGELIHRLHARRESACFTAAGSAAPSWRASSRSPCREPSRQRVRRADDTSPTAASARRDGTAAPCVSGPSVRGSRFESMRRGLQSGDCTAHRVTCWHARDATGRNRRQVDEA